MTVIWLVGAARRKCQPLLGVAANDIEDREACGGPSRLSVYTSTGNVTVFPVPTIQNTSLPGSWQYQGCLA